MRALSLARAAGYAVLAAAATGLGTVATLAVAVYRAEKREGGLFWAGDDEPEPEPASCCGGDCRPDPVVTVDGTVSDLFGVPVVDLRSHHYSTGKCREWIARITYRGQTIKVAYPPSDTHEQAEAKANADAAAWKAINDDKHASSAAGPGRPYIGSNPA